MNKHPLKKIYDSRIFWAVISLLASLSIWIYVTSADSDDFRKVFRNVRVELVGEDSLESSRNLMVTDVSTSSVTVEITGPRRIVSAMNAEDLVAHIDVSKLTQSSYTQMTYDIVYPNRVDSRDLTVERKYPDYVNFNVSMLTSKSVPVRGGFEGTPAEGFTAEAPIFEPSTITVTGPEAYLKHVDHAWVTFGKDMEIESTYSVDTNFTLMDANGEPCSTEYLTNSQETIQATLPILMIKEVKIDVDLIEGAGASSANTKITIDPATITLAGDSAILGGLNRIVLATIDLTDFASTFSESYTIPFDNELRNLTGLSTANVSLEVVGLETRTYQVRNISYINASEDSTVEIITESLDVRLRGTSEQLDQVKDENIRAVADLTDFKDSTGAYMPAVKIYVDGFTDVGAIGDSEYAISVEIRKA